MLAARHGRHEKAAALIDQAAGKLRDAALTATLVELLSAQAGSYPEAEVRRLAADRARIAAAQRFGMKIDESEAGRLVTAIRRLVPEDLLLERDGHRFLRQRCEPVRPRPTIRPLRGLANLKEIKLPPFVWRGVAATDDAIFAVGFRERELVVIRSDWRGRETDSPIGQSWVVQPGQVESPILLAIDRAGLGDLLVHIGGAPPLPHRKFFKTTDQFPALLAAGPHPGVSALTHAACYSGHKTVHVVDFGAGHSLVIHSYLGPTPLADATTIDLASLSDRNGAMRLPLPCCVCDETLCLGVGRHLCFVRGGVQNLETPHSVTQLIASPPHTRLRVAIAMEQGALLLWGNDQRAASTSFASDLPAPLIALTRDGSLVAASQDEIELYSTRDSRLTLRERLRTSQSSPLALVASGASNRVALLYSDGRLVIGEIPV